MYNSFKSIEFKISAYITKRRIHIWLQSFSVFLSLLLIVMLYNETYNEYKLSKIKQDTVKIDTLKYDKSKIINQINNVKNNFEFYLKRQNEEVFNNYVSSIDSLKNLIKRLEINLKENSTFSKYSNSTSSFVKSLHVNQSSITNIYENVKSFDYNNKDLSPFVIYNYDDILKSIDVKSSVEIDSVKKKGILSRVAKAIKGNVDVQKEKHNVLITMKFGKKISTAPVEDQFKEVFERTNNHYASEFNRINSGFSKKASACEKFDQLIFHSNKINDDLNQVIQSLEKSIIEIYNNQYDNNRLIRIIVMILIVLSLIISSIFLFFMTRLTYEYQDSLEESRIRILNNLKFKNRIVGMISHEVRAPLNIISIYIKSIGDKIQDVYLKDSLKTIQYTTSSLLILSNQILEYSKNEDKKMVLNNSNFNLKSEMSELIDSLKTLIEFNDNKIELDCNIHNNCMVNSDIVKIQQLFYNIVGNANKFTNNGIISIQLEVKDLSNGTYNFFVKIQDNGKGIHQKDLENVFEAYSQSGVLDKAHNLGAGLGLSLCKDIIKLFGGEINISSKIGEGTKVVFNLFLNKTN